MNDLFMECLRPIARMMRKQMNLAKKAGLEVEVGLTHKLD
jgi:hypothetical protein